MNSVFTHHGVKWTQQKIAANPRVGAGMSHLALKFGPELGGNGRVRPRLLDVEVDLCDLTPMAERPIFLNEGAVQSYLWGCEKALSWLANGKEAIAYWEPSYYSGTQMGDTQAAYLTCFSMKKRATMCGVAARPSRCRVALSVNSFALRARLRPTAWALRS